MKKVPPALRIFLFLLFSLELAFFFQFKSQASSFTILHHSYKLQFGPFILSVGLFFWLLIGLWAFFSFIHSKFSFIPYKEALACDFLSYWPILLLALAPLALLHYLTFDDLQTRLALFILAVLLSILYLKIIQALHLSRERRTVWKKLSQKFLALTLRNKLFVLFLLALLIYNAGALVMTSRGITFSGDEPHYLLIAHSLLYDKDLDLTNNYGHRDYTRYKIPEVRPHTVPGTKPNSVYSFHSPGVSILLILFYSLGMLLGKNAIFFFVRMGMSIFGALLGIQVYLYARQEWQREKLALGLWFLFSFTSPVFFYSIHVYPEIVVALFSLIAFRLFRFSSNPSRLQLLFCGLILSSLIWFHALKYLLIMGPLFLYGVWILFRNQKARRLVYFLAFPVLNIALYLYFQYTLYGSLSPTSISLQGAMNGRQTLNFLQSMFTDIPLRHRWESLAGYFLDQRDGLLFYAPIYFFALLGLVEMVRRKAGDLFILFFITAPYILHYAFFTQRAGYAPQARPLVAVIWGMAILLGYFLAYNAKKIFSYLLNFATALSLLFVWLLLQNPLALYQETTVGITERGGDLFYRLSNLHHHLTNWLPSFIKVEEWRWPPNFIWLFFLIAFLVAYLIIRKHEFSLKFSQHQALTFCGLVVFFAWFVFYPRLALYPPVRTALPSGDKFTFYGLSRVALMRQPAKFAILEDNRYYNFYFASWRKIPKVEVEFGSLTGDYILTLNFFDQPMMKEKTQKEVRTRIFDSPPSYRWKNLNLYYISIHLERRSDVRTALNPYLFAIRPVR